MLNQTMIGRKIFLCLFLIILFVSGKHGQEVVKDEETAIVDHIKDAVSTKNPHPDLIFPKDRTPISDGLATRIIGGEVAIPHDYPYQAALLIAVGTSTYFCGATLISTEWVLTAAHCVDEASWVLVHLGAHNISETESTTVTLNSSKFIIHENWNETLLQNDIALIHLPRNVTLNDYIDTVPIAKGTSSYSGIIGRCIGWGRTVLGILSSVLRFVDAEVMTNTQCSQFHAIYTPYIVDHHLCISGEGTVGSCSGDSGGPLIINGTQVGIVSFGYTNCSAGWPSVFTRVTEFSDWISKNTNSGSRISPIAGLVAVVLSIVFLNFI